MYRTANGEEIFVIDGHTHFWDGSPANQKNIHGKQFIECFYAYHANLSPPSEKWTLEKFEKYDVKTMHDDLFVHGYDDMAILQPTYLGDFYKDGFNTTERNYVMKKSHPDRFILNSAFDPRDGDKGLEALHANCEKYHVKGVKLYTAEWKGESKGYKLTDKDSYKFLEAAQKYGIKNIHVHKGPTIIPLNKDAFDVGDIDDVATSFQDLNFIVEHCGLPRLDDFCWIATQETNVYGGLAVALPFIHTRPGYFGHVMSELLFWIGPEKLLYGSDYGIWTPKWLIDKFMASKFRRRRQRRPGRF
jgi:predicted TIM-barrel fold metal-dependent hydrolase